MNALQLSRSADLPPVGAAAEVAELWAWALPLGLLGAWTCFQKVPGANWPLWTIAAATGLLVVTRRCEHSNALSRTHAALGLAAILSIAAAVTANPVADGLIFLSVASLFGFSLLATAMRTGDIGLLSLIRAPLDVSRLLFGEAAARVAETFAIVRMRDTVPIVRGSTMALAFAATLFLLLSAADPTLADWRQIAWDTVLSRMFLARDVFFVALTMLLLGGYGLAARKPKPTPETLASSGHSRSTSAARFSHIERVMVLGAAIALFTVFFAAELSHQPTSSALHLMPGETFAEATHRGFGEMIIAAVLCAIVIIALDQHALRGERELSVRLLSVGVVLASLVVVACAYLRVHYYEAAYGYTQQRLYVQICCGMVLMSLLCLAWELRSAIHIPRLIRHVALTAIACVAGLSYWNHSAWIVDANVGRYARTGKLDVDYLERLGRISPDAIPALIEALPHLTPADAQRVRESLRRTSPDQSILQPQPAAGEPSWYEWSLRRVAARSALRAAGLDGSTTR